MAKSPMRGVAAGNSPLVNKMHAIARSGRVLRYHVEDVLHRQNVGEHTYNVLWFIRLITQDSCSAELLMAALAHDTAEFATGDIPAPVKRMPGMKERFDTMEDSILEDLGMQSPQLSDEEARILKLADCLEGAHYSVYEMTRGNHTMLTCAQNYLDYLTTLEPKGVAGEIFQHIKGTYNGLVPATSRR